MKNSANEVKLYLIKTANRLPKFLVGTFHLHVGGRISHQRRDESFKEYLARDAKERQSRK